jgi:hypothetical protein
MNIVLPEQNAYYPTKKYDSIEVRGVGRFLCISSTKTVQKI